MHAVTNSQQEPRPDEQLHDGNFSQNYKGGRTARNASADIPDELNCSLFVVKEKRVNTSMWPAWDKYIGGACKYGLDRCWGYVTSLPRGEEGKHPAHNRYCDTPSTVQQKLELAT
jgi:hypothetical protein